MQIENDRYGELIFFKHKFHNLRYNWVRSLCRPVPLSGLSDLKIYSDFNLKRHQKNLAFKMDQYIAIEFPIHSILLDGYFNSNF